MFPMDCKMFPRDLIILALSAVYLASFPNFGNASKDTERNNILGQDHAHRPLCDIYGIQDEISKAIEALKRKAEVAKMSGIVTTPPNNGSAQLRQDDDDDELPYYVAPIAKVVASVLAQNATNVIEESFGFIPPEINEQIRYVLGLVAETVAKLKPTEAPTEATTTPTQKVAQLTTPPAASPGLSNDNLTLEGTPPLQSFKGGDNCVDGNCSNIESLVAYALAQQLANVIISKAGEANDKPGSLDNPFIPLVIEDAPNLESTTPKFEYSEGLSVTSTLPLEGAANADVVSVYAPAYAPNYLPVPSTSVPNHYAPAFDYTRYTTPRAEPPPTQKTAAFSAFPPPTTTGAPTPVEETTDEYDTTEDYDYYGGGSESAAATLPVTSPSVVSSQGQGGVTKPLGGVGVATAVGNKTSVAGSDDDEDYDGRTGDNTEIRRSSIQNPSRASSPQLKL